MRALKGLILVLAIAGVAALVLASHSTARPLTAISAVNPAMNFAYVRIEGVVLDYPQLSTIDGYLSFQVRDQSGDMRVQAYRTTVDALLAAGQIPMPGDRVAVEGTLRVRDEDTSMTLNAAEALVISATTTQPITLAALDAMKLGERASVIGQVRQLRDTSAALRIASLRDGDAQAELLMPTGIGTLFGEPPALEVGDWVSVTGGVGEYRGVRQLMPAKSSDVTRLADRHLSPLPIGALSRSMVGRWVAVHGQVAKLRPVKGGELIDLKDDQGGAITVVMFETWFEAPFSQTLHVGNALTAQGAVTEYNGQLELQPELSVDVMKAE